MINVYNRILPITERIEKAFAIAHRRQAVEDMNAWRLRFPEMRFGEFGNNKPNVKSIDTVIAALPDGRFHYAELEEETGLYPAQLAQKMRILIDREIVVRIKTGIYEKTDVQ